MDEKRGMSLVERREVRLTEVEAARLAHANDQMKNAATVLELRKTILEQMLSSIVQTYTTETHKVVEIDANTGTIRMEPKEAAPK